MKKQISMVLVTALLASTSFGQSSTAQAPVAEDGISSKGFRVALVKPMLSADITASRQGRSGSASGTLDSALGFSLGYASLPVQELGWTSNLTYMDIKDEGGTAGAVRLDGNLAYAFTPIANFKCGLNFSKLTSGTTFSSLNPGIGFQGGLGIQITKNFGFDVGYTEMNQSGSIDGIQFDVKEKGMEIGVNGTF